MFSLTPVNFSKRFLNPFDDFDDFFNFPAMVSAPAAYGTDIKHTDGAYSLEMDLPGFSKEDISLEVKENTLRITAERKAENEEKKDDGYVRRGRFSGRIEKSFDISGIDAEAITAGYENGVLTVTLPEKKIVEPEAKKIFIA